MRLTTRFHLLLLLVLLATTGVALFRIAPDFVFPAHWGHGGPDWLWPRDIALTVAPLIALILVIAFELLARIIGPKRMKFVEHILDPALTLLLAVTAAVQLGLLLIGIGSDLDLVRVTVFALGAVLVLLGIVLAEAERHTYAGMRLPWPIASDRAGRMSHRCAGIAFGLSGAGLLLFAWFTGDTGPLILAMPPAMVLPGVIAAVTTIATDRS